jgi:hypothetical protein
VTTARRSRPPRHAIDNEQGFTNPRPGHIPTPPRPRPVRARPAFPQRLAASFCAAVIAGVEHRQRATVFSVKSTGARACAGDICLTPRHADDSSRSEALMDGDPRCGMLYLSIRSTRTRAQSPIPVPRPVSATRDSRRCARAASRTISSVTPSRSGATDRSNGNWPTPSTSRSTAIRATVNAPSRGSP